jgi:hypothetical protein
MGYFCMYVQTCAYVGFVFKLLKINNHPVDIGRCLGRGQWPRTGRCLSPQSIRWWKRWTNWERGAEEKNLRSLTLKSSNLRKFGLFGHTEKKSPNLRKFGQSRHTEKKSPNLRKFGQSRHTEKKSPNLRKFGQSRHTEKKRPKKENLEPILRS